VASPKTHIRKQFPKLSPDQFSVTSPKDPAYNCIAHAARDGRFWWPINAAGYYWPPQLPYEITLTNFIEAFRLLGYVPCETYEPERGFEKVVIYVGKDGRPTHMARLLPNGLWTSKLGKSFDIDHKTLAGLEGTAYGKPQQPLKRPLPK
jgi:hypothetical protein